MSQQDDQIIIDFLKQRGHSDEEVQKVLKRLEQYDDATMRQSVFDSIAGGGFDIDQIIDDALKD